MEQELCEKDYPLVESAEFENEERGGKAITVVDLKL